MKRLLAIVMALVMCLSLLPVSALADTTASGTCGEKLEWTLENGTLTISGTGEMDDYDSEDVGENNYVTTAPWGHNYQSIKSIVIEDGITSVGEMAFCGCNSLKSVSISDSVTSIGNHAFEDCSSLTSITIPDSVTSIGVCAFSGCSSLTSIMIPDSVTTIDGGAFYGCSSLTSVTIPVGVTRIRDIVFSGCSSLISVTIPDSVTSIGDSAFYGCSSLATVTIPDSITSIGYSAFHDCSSLTSVTIPDSVTSIRNEAFHDCSSMTSVTIGNGVTSIGNYTFYGCSSLKDVYYSGTISEWETIQIGQFNDPLNNAKLHFVDDGTAIRGECGDNLTWSLDDDGTLTISGAGAMNNYSLSKNANDEYVTTAPWEKHYESIMRVVIENGVTSVGEYAFRGCSSLTRVTIPDSLTDIGWWAFDNCSSITDVYYTGDLSSWLGISFSASSNPCHNGANLYFNGVLLTDVVIPNSITSVGSYAFHGCSGLTSVIIPDNVTSIGYSAFSGCSSLISVTIPDSVTSIGASAFRGCSSLTSVTIPDGVTSIGAFTFYGCSSLTSVTIPSSVTSIDYYAFDGCSSLTSITIPSSVTSIGAFTFYGCSSLTSVTIPSSVTSIGDSAFKGCSSLTSVTIPVSVTSIGDSAFYGCSSLTSVTIPDSVTSIGNYTFDGCSRLKDVYYSGTISEWTAIQIGSSNAPLNNAKLYLADGSFVLRGECGDNHAWSLDSNGTLTISGTGDMTNYDGFYLTTAPWGQYYESIKSVVFKDGVTTIGNSAFCGCSSLTSVTVPDSITNIGDSAFKGCDKIKDVAFAGTKEAWNAIGYTFSGVRMHYNCASLEDHYVLMEILEPTCESAGYKKYNCVCGYEYKEIIPINHNYEFSKAVASTCISYGYDLFVCSKCGAEKREYYNELSDHNYQITTVEPSCLTGGYTLHKCSGCGDSYKDELVPALGHSEVSTGAKAPTCTEAGHTAGTCCSRCGKAMSGMEEIAALGHSFGDWTQTKAPTCTASGTESRTCANCGETETRAVAATGHHYTTKVIAPTCTVKGHTIYTCTCGDSYISDYVDALGHDRVHHEGKAPTCTEKGWEAYDTCSRCDYSTYKEIAATGHHYTAKVTAPSCTRKGYTTYTCVCGDRYVDNYVAATGHNFGKWTQTKTPTCTASGTEIRSCTRCNTTETRIVTFLGHDTVYHDGKAATCTEKGWEAYDACTRCDYTNYKEIAALGHDCVHHEGKAPTCTEKGWEAYDTCSRCDYSTYKEIAATGHHYTDTVTAPTCTEKGYTTHTCACGNSYVDSYTNALGHSYKNGVCTRCNAKDPGYVAAPVIKITTSAGKPKISWSKVDGATKYYIYRSTDGKTYKQYTTTTKTSYTNSNATIGTTYYYKVKASKVVNGKTVKSVYSNIKSIKCTPAAPVVSISRSNGKPKLTWKAVTGASKYYIYRSTDGKNYKQYTTTTKTSYTNTGAASGKKYYYKVKAVAVVNKKNVFSAYSTAKNLMTTIATPTVSITTSNGKPKITWKAVTGADKYIVYRSTDGKTFKQLSTTTKTSLTNTGAKKNTKYYYKVKAVCTKNTSANSALSKAVNIKATK